MIEKILNIIFPTCCGICKRLYKTWLCPKCYYNLKKECKYIKLEKENFYIYCIGKYEKNIRKLILRFKFKENAYLARTFAEIISKNKEFIHNIKQYDYIVPVPMYIENKNIRGYNQTELLAKRIKESLGIDYIQDALIKAKQNKKQSSLSEKERAENVKDVYRLQNSEKLKNKKILLLDDIYTTGSTIKACREELVKSEADKIDVLVLAKRKI